MRDGDTPGEEALQRQLRRVKVRLHKVVAVAVLSEVLNVMNLL